MVTCDSQDTEKYDNSFPCLIVEVLSPSTQDLDRR
ncbi:MAG: Uma2 family endonuclease [Microcoleaceae cyanobacterium MO_207.B10]|nr:Uma2 family endonuclease [Microcoleaceae cyanobacterium MO_207.B10]